MLGWSLIPSVNNPIVDKKGNGVVIKGGAFDQLIRKTISPSREEIAVDSNRSA